MAPTTPGDDDEAFLWDEDGSPAIVGQDGIDGLEQGTGSLPEGPEARSAIRSWLQPTLFGAESGEYHKHLSSHLDGTGDWLFSSASFRRWHDSDDQGMLWIQGIPGSGKSVVAATMVDRLSREGVPVLYFFFRQIIDANHKPVSLLRDWLAQLLDYSPLLRARLQDGYIKKNRELSTVSMHDLWRELRTAFSHLPKVYCVVDALDEMDQGNDAFLQTVAELGGWQPSRVKIVLTSRPIVGLQRSLRQAPALQLRLEESVVDKDIAAYVEHRLLASTIPGSQHEAIKQAVPGRANGLFLYAKLAMDAFLEEGADVQEVLNTLPLDLNAMYTDLLQEHARRSGTPDGLQRLILSWVTHATRPLRLLEMAEMIDATGERPAGAGGLKTTKDLVREACGPLLEILPDETVCIIHHSLTEFLNGSTRRPEDNSSATDTALFYPVLDLGATHDRLALACVSYLQSVCLEISQSVDLASADKDAETDADDFVSFAGYEKSVSNIVSKVEKLAQRPFMHYSLQNWHIHAKRSEESGVFSRELFDELWKLFSGGGFSVLTVLIFRRNTETTPLHLAAQWGLQQLVKQLLEKEETNVNAVDARGETALSTAASNGHVAVVKLLLDSGAKPDEPSGCDGLKPLHHAARKNHAEVVHLLLAAGVDPLTAKTKDDPGRFCGNMPSSLGHTALMYAIEFGHEDAAKAFLPYLKDSQTVTRALEWAATGGHSVIVEALVKHPRADVNARCHGDTTLFLAAKRVDFKSVIALLKAGADPNTISWWVDDAIHGFHEGGKKGPYPAGAGFSALHALCGLSRGGGSIQPGLMQECMALMISAGVDVNLEDKYGRTPLYYASRWSLPLVKLLLEAGADANQVLYDGSTALYGCGVAEIVRTLVQDGKADINRPRVSDGRTPFLCAVSTASVELLRLYAELGADPTQTGRDGQGALHLYLGGLASHGVSSALEIIKELLAAGVPPNLRDHQGKTALQLLDINYRQQIVEALVAAGADLNNQDNQGQTMVFHLKKHTPVITSLEMLRSLGARMDMVDFGGRNLLRTCFRMPDFDLKMAGKLIEWGLDANSVDYEGNTLCHEAILRRPAGFYGGDLKTVMKLDIDVDQRNNAGRSPLHLICAVPNRVGLPEAETISLFKHIDVKDNDGVRPLHVAARSSPRYVAALLASGASATEPTHEGMTPLHVAARFRQPDIVGMLLEAIEGSSGKEGVKNHLNNSHRPDIPSALHLACRSGQPETVTLLLAAGADPNASSADVPLPLMWCTEFEEEDALWKAPHAQGQKSKQNPREKAPEMRRFGIGLDETTRDPDRESSTPRLEGILLDLHAYGADFTTPPTAKHGRTNLDAAIFRSQDHDYTTECLVKLRMLLDGSGIIQHDNISIGAGDFPAIRKLLDNGDDVTRRDNISIMGDQFQTIELKRYVNKWLLQGVQRTPPDRHIISSIDRLAATRLAYMNFLNPMQLGNPGNIKSLQLTKSLLIELISQREWGLAGEWLRREGSEQNRQSAISLLVLRGIDSVLRYSLSREDAKKAVRAYEEHLRFAPWERNKRTATELLIITACKRKESNMTMFRYLVEELGISVDAQAPIPPRSDAGPLRGDSAMHVLVAGDSWWHVSEALPYLVDRGADLELRDAKGQTPLLRALSSKGLFWKKAVSILIERGANVSAVDQTGKDCLAYASNDVGIARLLVRRGATVTAAALREAIRKCELPVLEALLSAGADANMRSPPCDQASGRHMPPGPVLEHELYPLYMAAKSNPIDWKADADTPTGKMLDRHVPVVEMLLEHGADPFVRFMRMSRVDPVSRNRDYEEVVLLHELLEKSAIVGPILRIPNLDLEYRDGKGRTLLLAACRSSLGPESSIDTAFATTSTGRWMNSTYERNGDQPSLAQFLLDRGASVAARDNEQKNALHHVLEARTRGGHEVMRLLLRRAPELANQPDAEGATPLLCALRREQGGPDVEAVELLLDAGADPNAAADAAGNGPLHHLGERLAEPKEPGERLRALFRRFVALGVAADALNRAGETAAFAFLRRQRDYFCLPGMEDDCEDECEAERARQPEAFRMLVDAGADLRAASHTGETLLHVVAARGRGISGEPNARSVMLVRFRWLLDAGLDPMAEDAEQRTCLDVAALNGNEPILKLFERKD